MAKRLGLLVGFLVGLSACSGGGADTTPRVPEPGRDRVLQFYALMPKDSKVSGLPSNDMAWESALGARAEFADALSRAEASETLRAWSARPVDVLLVAGKEATEALFAAKLPKGAPKLVVSIDAARPVEGAVNLRLETKDLEKLQKKLCEALRPRASNCERLVVWEVDWPRLFARLYRDFLAEGSLERTRSEIVDFGSGYLKVIPGPGLKSDVETDAFRKSYEAWSLEVLRR